MNAAFRRVVSTLLEGREVEYGLLGITPSALLPEEVHAGQSGVRIDHVLRGSPAEQGGLVRGDIYRDAGGLPLIVKLQRGLDPTKPDTDGDGRPDAVELEQGSDPKVVDTAPAVLARPQPSEAPSREPKHAARSDPQPGRTDAGPPTSRDTRRGCRAER